MSSPPREFSGRDIMEALQDAARAFGVRRSELGYEVLEEGRKGVLGIGARQCVLRAWPRAGVESRGADAPPRADARPRSEGRPDDDSRGRGGRGGRGGGRRNDHGPSRGGEYRPPRARGPRSAGGFLNDDAIPARLRDRPHADRDDRRPRGGSGHGPGGGRPNRHEDRRDGHPAHRGQRQRRDDARPAARGGDRRHGGRGRHPAEDRDERQSTPTVPATEAHAHEMKDLMEELVAAWGMEMDVSTRLDGDTVWLSLDGPDASRLTDENANLLEALQYLVSKMASRLLADNVRILLDAQGYRARRETELRQLAATHATEARDSGRPVRLPPLNAYERRIIHVALGDEADVRTYSIGRGYYKRVTVDPSPGRRKARAADAVAAPIAVDDDSNSIESAYSEEE